MLCLQHKLEVYITKLFQRLNWLASGSRVPIGTVAEKRSENMCMHVRNVQVLLLMGFFIWHVHDIVVSGP